MENKDKYKLWNLSKDLFGEDLFQDDIFKRCFYNALDSQDIQRKIGFVFICGKNTEPVYQGHSEKFSTFRRNIEQAIANLKKREISPLRTNLYVVELRNDFPYLSPYVEFPYLKVAEFLYDKTSCESLIKSVSVPLRDAKTGRSCWANLTPEDAYYSALIVTSLNRYFFKKCS